MDYQKLGKVRVGRKWGFAIFTVDVDRMGVTLRALVPEYAYHRWGVTPAELWLSPVWFDEVMSIMGQWLQKAVESAATPEGAVHFRDEAMERQFPALYDFLASKIGPGGKPRESACLLVFARDGEVTACLKDRGLKKAFYGRSDGLQTALVELEKAIQANA